MAKLLEPDALRLALPIFARATFGQYRQIKAARTARTRRTFGA
jgi:hypothetical protein